MLSRVQHEKSFITSGGQNLLHVSSSSYGIDFYLVFVDCEFYERIKLI